MTTQIIETYFQLLRQAIGFTTVDGGQCTYSVDGGQCTMHDEDLEAVVHLAQIQGTAPLIFNELLSLPFEDSVSSDETGKNNSRGGGTIKSVMKQVCMQNMVGYEQLLDLLKKTWNGLVDGGVQPVVLKGFGLATLYPTPYLRSWGDLDMYVGPNQYHQAAKILRHVFPHAEHHDEEWEELKHYNFVLPDGNVIEMHRTAVKLNNPIDNKYFWRLEKEAMNPENVQWVEIEDVRFAIPEAKFNLLFTFFHAWFHFVEEEVGFKQICDVALLAHHTYNQQSAISNQQSFAKYMQTNLRKLHLWEPWQLMGYVCVEALGLPKAEWPLYEEGNSQLQMQRERFLQHVITNGLLPRNKSKEKPNRSEEREKIKRMNYFARKWKTLKSRFADAHIIQPYSPNYARHMIVGTFIKGISRTLTGAKMIDY